MDEVDLDAFLREASEAIEDPDKLAEFVREKSTIAIERFLVRIALLQQTSLLVESFSHIFTLL